MNQQDKSISFPFQEITFIHEYIQKSAPMPAVCHALR